MKQVARGGVVFEKNEKSGEYLEFQYYKQNNLSVENLNLIEHWKSDSLFVNANEKSFYLNYENFFNCSTLANGKIGFDLYGVNFYNPQQTKSIYKTILDQKNLPGKTVILDWLKIAAENNYGFLILGI